MSNLNKYTLLPLLVLLLAACTTQKKRDELTGLSKVWHNTTAHYNGYFNANEILLESELLLNEQHEDNYLQLLDVYEYVAVDNPQSVAGELDEAIKKVTVVVNLHPLSQWSDDCYLLAGRAMYLQQDYEAAEKAFRYLINEYPPETKAEATAKRSKGRENADKRKRSNSGRTRSTASRDDGEPQASPLPMTARERDKARKAYNREVKRKKRERERARAKGQTTTPVPRREREETETDTPTPTPTPTPRPQAETPPPPPVEAPVGMVRLSDNAETLQGEAGDQYRMKHRPVFQEGQLWLARTLIERDNYEAARRILNSLTESASTFSDVRREVAVAQAHLYLKEKNHAAASTALATAAEQTKDREQEARLQFILAQVHEKLGNAQAAYAAFERVARLRPNYAMEFAARLMMAQNAWRSGGGSAAEAIANLERLLKEEKNRPYRDQVYFAMAEIALSSGDKENGMAYLQQSLTSSSSNRAQQTEAYYRLGTLFFEQEEYLAAKLYYDSTLNVMANTDERYLPTERLRDNLTDIAQNLATIELQDSLIRVAAMTPEEQAELAKNLYEAQRKPAAAPASSRDKFGMSQRAAALSKSGLMDRTSTTTGALRTDSDFWAYDDRTVKRGEREFDRRWGDRPLTDNWRLSSKLEDSPDERETEEVVDVNLLTDEQIDKILADVPKESNDLKIAELAIKQAMFNLGRLYRDRLENSEKSVEILEALNERFPGNLYELDSWYYLYLAHSDLGHASQAQAYKDKIIQKYPTTKYGQILTNPNYAQDFLDEEQQLDRDYQLAYQLFEQEAFAQALQTAQGNLSKLVGKHPLKPRYALLMAMCTGNAEGKEAYIRELNKVVATYPNTAEETRAKEILRLLGAGGASLPGRLSEDSGDFKVSDNELHYVIIVFQTDDIDLNAQKIKVSDYNRTHHSLDKLRISNVYLGSKNDIPVLVLRRFKNKNTAMAYYQGSQTTNADDFIDANATPYQLFPISQSNYREVLRNRNVDGYDAFFEANYK
jgi:tetratricopeptide (TPR) repeat protein